MQRVLGAKRTNLHEKYDYPLKGDALRAVRAWLAMQDERRHLATVTLVVAFGMAVVVTGIAHFFRWYTSSG